MAETCSSSQFPIIPSRIYIQGYWRTDDQHASVLKLVDSVSFSLLTYSHSICSPFSPWHLLYLLVSLFSHISRTACSAQDFACVLMPLPCLPDFKPSEVLSTVHSNELCCDGFWLPLQWQFFFVWTLVPHEGWAASGVCYCNECVRKLVRMEGKVMCNLVMQWWFNGWHGCPSNVQM